MKITIERIMSNQTFIDFTLYLKKQEKFKKWEIFEIRNWLRYTDIREFFIWIVCYAETVEHKISLYATNVDWTVSILETHDNKVVGTVRNKDIKKTMELGAEKFFELEEK